MTSPLSDPRCFQIGFKGREGAEEEAETTKERAKQTRFFPFSFVFLPPLLFFTMNEKGKKKMASMSNIDPSTLAAAASAVENIDANQVSITNLPTTLVNILPDAQRASTFKCSSLRLLSCGGAPISRAFIERGRHMFTHVAPSLYPMA